MVLDIQQLAHDNAINAIKSLKSNKKFIQGSKGQDLKLSVIVEDIENGNYIKANALLDSGAMESCQNKDFIKHHNIHLQKLPEVSRNA